MLFWIVTIAYFTICFTYIFDQNKKELVNLKGSYDVAKKNIILCIWCNAVYAV